MIVRFIRHARASLAGCQRHRCRWVDRPRGQTDMPVPRSTGQGSTRFATLASRRWSAGPRTVPVSHRLRGMSIVTVDARTEVGRIVIRVQLVLALGYVVTIGTALGRAATFSGQIYLPREGDSYTADAWVW